MWLRVSTFILIVTYSFHSEDIQRVCKGFLDKAVMKVRYKYFFDPSPMTPQSANIIGAQGGVTMEA